MSADLTPENQAVKRGHAVKFVRRHPEKFGDVLYVFIGYPAAPLLYDLQCLDARGLLKPVFFKNRFNLLSSLSPISSILLKKESVHLSTSAST